MNKKQGYILWVFCLLSGFAQAQSLSDFNYIYHCPKGGKVCYPISVSSLQLKEFETPRDMPRKSLRIPLDSTIQNFLNDYEKRYKEDALAQGRELLRYHFSVDTTLITVNERISKSIKNQEDLGKLRDSIQNDQTRLIDYVIQLNYLGKKELGNLDDLKEIKIASDSATVIVARIESTFAELNKQLGIGDKISNVIETFPSVIGTKDYVRPKANVIAWNQTQNRIWSTQLFIGNSQPGDTLETSSLSNLLIPESSNFGFNIKGLRAFGPLNTKGKLSSKPKNFALEADAYFLLKNVGDADTTAEREPSINTAFVQFRLGAEYELIPNSNVFTIKGGYNVIRPITQVDNFEQFYGVKNKFFNYLDLGFKADLNLDDNKRDFIRFDATFIFRNGTTNSISDLENSRDDVIPVLQLGYVKLID